MKKILMTLLLAQAIIGFSQPPGGDGMPPHEERKEKIKAHKIAFISTELDLTPEEAEKFWPVYNQFDAELEKLREEKFQAIRKLRKLDEVTDEEAYTLTKKIFEIEEKESAVRMKYLDKFAEVLDKKKAAKVFIAEQKFKRELLRKIKHGGHGPKHDGPPQGPHH